VAESEIRNPKSEIEPPLVAIIMGSTSDWETMKNAADILNAFYVPHESKVVSAHRTPDLLFEFAKAAESRGIEVIIAGAGGAAHLPGMCASQTVLPVLGVPVQSKALSGLDSLLRSPSARPARKTRRFWRSRFSLILAPNCGKN
jgi:phosphoribosylaminoimidazole carboxylase PurE protein